MKLKIKVEGEFIVDDNTKIITNGTWITLCRKGVNEEKHVVFVFTCLASKFTQYELDCSKNWIQFTKEELQKILKIK